MMNLVDGLLYSGQLCSVRGSDWICVVVWFDCIVLNRQVTYFCCSGINCQEFHWVSSQWELQIANYLALIENVKVQRPSPRTTVINYFFGLARQNCHSQWENEEVNTNRLVVQCRRTPNVMCGQLFWPTALFIAHILAEFLGHAALREITSSDDCCLQFKFADRECVPDHIFS